MWLLGTAPILIVVLAAGMVAFGAAVSWVAFRTRNAFTVASVLAAASLAVGAIAWWQGIEEHAAKAAIPFEVAAVVTIGSGLVMALGELARSRRGPDDHDDPNWPPT